MFAGIISKKPSVTLEQHLSSKEPKRILSLDGGGIRGALTLGYLQQMETILKKQSGRGEAFRLSDYFDLIGGTSTGSIIAAGLCIGMSVAEIKEKYFSLGAIIFGRKYRWWNPFEWFRFLRGGYDEKPLEKALQATFGDITLASDKVRTGLCIVAKRADTNSLWPLNNHPGGTYYNSEFGRNKDIPVWKAVRASTAAPTYFIPQVVDVGGGFPRAAFIDGAVSMANNPALQLLMVATLKGYPFRWEWGADKLLLVSVGTGLPAMTTPPSIITRYTLFKWAKNIPEMLMQDANWHNQLMLQWMSRSSTRSSIDAEIGDMKDDLLSFDANSQGLISYLRYNVQLTKEGLSALMNKDYKMKAINNLVEMSHAGNRFELFELGVKAAEQQMTIGHFPAAFNHY